MASPITFRKLSLCISFAKQFIHSPCRMQNMRIVCMSSVSNDTQKDPFPLYASQDVQTILRRITGFDLVKVAGPRKTLLKRPVYKLLTDAELSQEQESARKRLSQRLDNPPPYMNARKPVKDPLVVDPNLARFDSYKYVFSDISFGVKDRERSVVVREVDGTLRVAPWDLRERMNQLYNPREGRSIVMPKIFEEENLERLISENKFVYILERACAQFEPDDPDFLRTCHRVYSAINSSRQFGILRSTQFFAPMTFHLVWMKMMDKLLVDMLTGDLESDAVDVITLYCMVHPDGDCAAAIKNVNPKDIESVIKPFLETEAQMASEVELALQSVLDRRRSGAPKSVSSS